MTLHLWPTPYAISKIISPSLGRWWQEWPHICNLRGVKSALDKTIYLPYGAIEMEPAFPSTNMGFQPVKEVLDRRESYPELRGWMGNNELMLLQFPRSFYFLNSLWDAQYPEKKEDDVLKEISGHLYLDHKDLIADSYLALQETDSEKIASTLSSLNALTQPDANLRGGSVGRFLFS